MAVLGGVLAAVLLALLSKGDGGIDLGLLEDHGTGAVVYHSTDGLFVVRLPAGPLIALSDLDPHNPPGQTSCRVTFRPSLGKGDEPGRFLDACTGSMYDVSGRALSADGLDLRRLAVVEDGGRLRAYPQDGTSR